MRKVRHSHQPNGRQSPMHSISSCTSFSNSKRNSNRTVPRQAREQLRLPLLRDAYKKRIGKDDSELFRTHFIETDLPICETVTRLDQAIRSLQAYLDDAALRASDSPAAASPPYRSYEVWRGERMATFYPELRALWRDDVLAYEANPLDRGSIIFKHVVNNPQIRTDLQSAADAIKEAKAVEVDSTGHEQPFSFREIHGVFYADL